MAELTLTLRNDVARPLDLSTISMDTVAGKTVGEISSLKVWRGNRQVDLGEVFHIEGSSGPAPAETVIVVKGSIPSARRLGKNMSDGSMIVEGHAGLCLGEGMKGGRITVNGDVGEWAGVQMSGGVLEVNGNASDHLASSYRGARSGMKGGTVIIHGDARNEVGGWMQEGVIKILGGAGLYVGVHMQGGSILVMGSCEGRAGAGMRGGKVILAGETPSVLPTFQIDEVRPSVKVGDEKIAGPFYGFIGDRADEGKGKLYVHAGKNPYLKRYEELIP